MSHFDRKPEIIFSGVKNSIIEKYKRWKLKNFYYCVTTPAQEFDVHVKSSGERLFRHWAKIFIEFPHQLFDVCSRMTSLSVVVFDVWWFCVVRSMLFNWIQTNDFFSPLSKKDKFQDQTRNRFEYSFNIINSSFDYTFRTREKWKMKKNLRLTIATILDWH